MLLCFDSLAVAEFVALYAGLSDFENAYALYAKARATEVYLLPSRSCQCR